MHRFVLVFMAGLLAAASAAAQSPCASCLLGVFDDPQMTRNQGAVGAFEVKSVYLGVDLAAGVEIRTLSFAATYPSGFAVVGWSSYVEGVRISPQGDGIQAEWPECISGKRLLFQVHVLGLDAVQDALLQLHDVVATSCTGDDMWQIPGGCYVLNPTGGPAPCGTATAPSTWASVKELFR